MVLRSVRAKKIRAHIIVATGLVLLAVNIKEVGHFTPVVVAEITHTALWLSEEYEF